MALGWAGCAGKESGFLRNPTPAKQLCRTVRQSKIAWQLHQGMGEEVGGGCWRGAFCLSSVLKIDMAGTGCISMSSDV